MYNTYVVDSTEKYMVQRIDHEEEEGHTYVRIGEEG